MSEIPNQDPKDIRNSSTLGLALGAIVFLGLGITFVFGIISDAGRIIKGTGATETFTERLIVIVVSLVMFFAGLSFLVVGASCFYHLRLGHNSKAIHRAYAKKAIIVAPSLEEYETKAAAAMQQKLVAA